MKKIVLLASLLIIIVLSFSCKNFSNLNNYTDDAYLTSADFAKMEAQRNSNQNKTLHQTDVPSNTSESSNNNSTYYDEEYAESNNRYYNPFFNPYYPPFGFSGTMMHNPYYGFNSSFGLSYNSFYNGMGIGVGMNYGMHNPYGMYYDPFFNPYYPYAMYGYGAYGMYNMGYTNWYGGGGPVYQSDFTPRKQYYGSRSNTSNYRNEAINRQFTRSAATSPSRRKSAPAAAPNNTNTHDISRPSRQNPNWNNRNPSNTPQNNQNSSPTRNRLFEAPSGYPTTPNRNNTPTRENYNIPRGNSPGGSNTTPRGGRRY